MKKTLLTTLAVASSLAFACVANAAENNPFGLVYKGAIMENVKGKVNIHPVTYTLNGLKIAANVYTPAGYEATKKYPAVVVAHPNGGVKEQVAGLYAQRLAEKGYITIAADGIGHNTNLTHAEQITMMTLWGIFRSPLIMGGEMRDNDAFTLSLLTNDELLNLNQNGTTPLQLFRDETKAAWLNFVGSAPYIALFNLAENRAVVSAELSEFTDKTHAEEIWSGEKTAFTKTLSAKIEPHGAKLYKLI